MEVIILKSGLIASVILILISAIRLELKNRSLKIDVNHQKALVRTLRRRLGDKQGIEPTLKELLEINKWSSQRIAELEANKQRLTYYANTGVYQPKGTMPKYKDAPKPPSHLDVKKYTIEDITDKLMGISDKGQAIHLTKDVILTICEEIMTLKDKI